MLISNLCMTNRLPNLTTLKPTTKPTVLPTLSPSMPPSKSPSNEPTSKVYSMLLNSLWPFFVHFTHDTLLLFTQPTLLSPMANPTEFPTNEPSVSPSMSPTTKPPSAKVWCFTNTYDSLYWISYAEKHLWFIAFIPHAADAQSNVQSNSIAHAWSISVTLKEPY